MVGWLVGWLADWLVGRFIQLLIYLSVLNQKGCNGMKKSQKKKKTDRESEKPSAFFHEKHAYAKPEVARKKSQKKKKTDREWGTSPSSSTQAVAT